VQVASKIGSMSLSKVKPFVVESGGNLLVSNLEISHLPAAIAVPVAAISPILSKNICRFIVILWNYYRGLLKIHD
jgi:hypothetical protein